MAITTPTQEEITSYNALRTQAADSLATEKLKKTKAGETLWTTGFTYRDLLSPAELRQVAILYNPTLKEKYAEMYGTEQLPKLTANVQKILDQRVKPYNNPPSTWSLADTYPEYVQDMEVYDSPDATAKREAYHSGQQSYISTDGTLKQIEWNPLIYDPSMTKPTGPPGQENAERIAQLGLNPANIIEFEGSQELLDAMAFLPRHATQKDLKYLMNTLGLEGNIEYIAPSNPGLGMKYKPKGAEEYQILDSPFIYGQDVKEFFRQEGPAIAGDILLTIAGTKKLEKTYKGIKFLPQLLNKVDPGIMKRVAQVSGMSFLSATGATGGDMLRLMEGVRRGYHDRDLMDILKESGMIGSLAFLGTFAISSAIKGIPAIWNRITGQETPPSFFQQMDDLLETASREAAGEGAGIGGKKGTILYGEQGSVAEIEEAIKYLSELTGEEIGKWRPTLASATGNIDAATLEALFLKYADDPRLINLYSQIKQGNQEVIRRFLNALNEQFAKELPTSPVTSAGLGETLRVAAQQEIDVLDVAAQDAIENMQKNWKIMSTSPDEAGAILRDVPDPNIGAGIFSRETPILKEIQKNYKKPFDDAWTDALKNSKYADLITGAGHTRGPAGQWVHARRLDTNALFKRAGTEEAIDELFKGTNKDVLRRLRGIGADGKMIGAKDVRFNLQELNQARVALNELASSSNNKATFRLARDLERGVEKQMNKLLEEGAAAESGISIRATKQLKQWMEETGYGYDLKSAWKAQTQAIEDVNTQIFKTILAGTPEGVIPSILKTNTKGAGKNTKLASFIKVLEQEGSDELLNVQQAMAGYIERNILKQADKTPSQIAKEYRQFMKDYKGTIKEIYGDGFKTFDYSPKSFNKNIIRKLDEIENTKQIIAARFGLANVANPTSTDIVYSILNASKAAKQSGQLLQDQKYLLDLIKDQPELLEQVATITKRWLTEEILTPVQGRAGLFDFDPFALNNLMTKGFGPEDVTGPMLTFDNWILPLLGKEGDEYLKLLKTWNNLAQREVGVEVAEEAIQRSYLKGTESSVEYFKKAVVPPLTQFGRRWTAYEKLMKEKTRAFIGDMLLHPKLFKETLAALQRKKGMDAFIRFLTSWGSVATLDMAEELSLYNEIDKQQPKRKKKPLDIARDIPSRISELELGAI